MRQRDERGEIPMTVVVISMTLCVGTTVASVLITQLFDIPLHAGVAVVLFVWVALIAGAFGASWIADVVAKQRTNRLRDERGASTAIVVLFAVALLTVAGLVIDGGYALGAKREAMNDAEQAARAGADALNPGALRDGQTMVDPGRAVSAAQSYLHSVGAQGTVNVNGGEVTVTVTMQQDTKILTAVGVGSIPVKATATALSIDQDD